MSGLDPGAGVSTVGDAQSDIVERVIVRRGDYHDRVTLMEASDAARSRSGVTHVAVGMSDRLDLHIIEARHGYDVGEDSLDSNDLVIAVRAETEDAADDAVAAIQEHLAARRGGREVVMVGDYGYAAEGNGGSSVERIDWRPDGQSGGARALARLSPHADRISRANAEAVARMQEARPLVVGIGTAGDLLPEMSARTLLHAGPPIEWADMSGPMRGAVIGAALLEGLASDPEDDVRQVDTGTCERR